MVGDTVTCVGRAFVTRDDLERALPQDVADVGCVVTGAKVLHQPWVGGLGGVDMARAHGEGHCLVMLLVEDGSATVVQRVHRHQDGGLYGGHHHKALQPVVQQPILLTQTRR